MVIDPRAKEIVDMVLYNLDKPQEELYALAEEIVRAHMASPEQFGKNVAHLWDAEAEQKARMKVDQEYEAKFNSEQVPKSIKLPWSAECSSCDEPKMVDTFSLVCECGGKISVRRKD